MATFSIKEKFGKPIEQIWKNKEFDNISIKKNGYASQDEIEERSLLFIGINPSISNENEWDKFYNNTQKRTEKTHKYFNRFFEISKEVGLRWSHIDLLFLRCTDQKEVAKICRKYENGTQFIWEQLMISKQIIEQAKPKIIVINNSFARRLLGKEKENGQQEWLGFDFKFDDSIGTDRIENDGVLKGTPVFFTSMLTGQRALDNGSFERLVWHINFVKDRLKVD